MENHHPVVMTPYIWEGLAKDIFAVVKLLRVDPFNYIYHLHTDTLPCQYQVYKLHDTMVITTF